MSNEAQAQLCIVLRAANYRDNDKILTLFSRTQGKLTASARGARNMKSRFAMATQPFCCAEYDLAKRNGRLYVTGALVKAEYYEIQNDYDRYMAGCVMLELADKMLEHTHEWDRLFVLLANTLFVMEKGTLAHTEALAYFLVQAADILGVSPALDFCAVCGRPVQRIAFWSAQEGGAVCEKCELEVNAKRADVMALQNFKLLKQTRPGRVQQPAENLARFISLANDYITEAGDIRLKTMKYFRDQ